MSWLVTGGAGYVGAHVVHALAATGAQVVVLDDLSTGDAGRLDALPAVPVVVGSVRDRGLVRRVLREHAVQGVVHLAAREQAEESGADPLTAWTENVEGLVALLEGCRAKGVSRFVLTSSTAVYGEPDTEPLTEEAPCRPLSPYGRTKLAGEWLLRDCAAAYGLAAVSLRLSDVAGAADPRLGDTSTAHLLPRVFTALDAGTPVVADPSVVRDHVHVADVVEAHLAAVRALEGDSPGGTYNVGTGRGTSVLDVLRVVAEVTGGDSTPELSGRRPEEPARVVPDVGRIGRELGWRARHDLHDVVASAWTAWRHSQPL
ncbi:NAD-dependent epimerase/dehydratase family protein [Modestobacter muralis]|uniref:UDP-glucose 4-epimerase n=1 Tax=Modestobacter muralis TaxID=1608614 RepID=A0A6P0HA06_9ACTN|nr:NAD-dependent epimerase/dehydratase family protein [Modestobacter muralis]NEK94778.1 NAD-dependent epimerase/dehydratase family protein [Modestobacter muralis]NEN51666.1 NAD-dependent epimerase/dehydratase family protein [Modestobacter muralis]